MKINMCGGVLTMPYNLAKQLRKKNIDVKLFINSSPEDESYSPTWEDEDIKENDLPDWIQKESFNLSRYFLGFREERKFLSRLADCDLIHAHGESCIWASFTEKPYIFQSYGFDLDYMPFLKKSLKHRALSYIMRRAIKKASCNLIGPYQTEAVKKIGVPTKKCDYQYWGVDTEKYKKVDTSLWKDIKEKYDMELIFFHPSRHEWSKTTNLNKGNDRLILAISKFLNLATKKVLFIFIEKGSDVQKSKKMINELGLQKNILWLKPMNKKKLIEYYSISDIVLDQFVVPGGMGQLALESMSIGIPTFIHIKNWENYYEEFPPVVNVSSPDEITLEMKRLSDDNNKRKDVGKKSREYILKYFSWSKIADKYIDLYKTLLNNN